MSQNYIYPIDKMVGDFDQFIGVWDSFYPVKLCDYVIEKGEQMWSQSIHMGQETDHGSKQFPDKKLGRSDFQMVFSDFDSKLSRDTVDYLKCCLGHYMEQYNQLKGVKLSTGFIKFQKTGPGGGYHHWHYESSSFHVTNRELAWMIYLNDMPDGEAETEFLYQKKRIKPKKGRVVIWPAGMTHVHRGNTVFSQDKYILTGWITQFA